MNVVTCRAQYKEQGCVLIAVIWLTVSLHHGVVEYHYEPENQRLTPH